jgi:dihydrofolate reductase
MGRISIDLFLTLDGVGQGPGGPGEDTSGGFRWSGWQAPVSDETVGAAVVDRIERLDALLLGRRTYDIWADFWPHQDDVIGRRFNSIPKYVASRSERDLGWTGSTRVGSDLAAEVRAVRDRHEDVHVIGSLDLAQTLLAEGLYDELALWIYPVVLGEGKRLFPEGAVPASLRLLEPPVVAGTGALFVRYAPAGEPTTGSMGPD